MTDLDFLKAHPKTRTTAARAIESLDAAGYSTVALCLQGGKEALTRLPYVTENTWAAIEEQGRRAEPLVYDVAMEERGQKLDDEQYVDFLAHHAENPLGKAVLEAQRGGPNSDAAVAAVEELLDLQVLHGFCRVDDGPNDFLWASSMARLLQIYRDAKPPSSLFPRIGEWWNQAVSLGIDSDVSDWINRAEVKANPSPAARIFYEMPDVPLPPPAKPYPVAG